MSTLYSYWVWTLIDPPGPLPHLLHCPNHHWKILLYVIDLYWILTEVNYNTGFKKRFQTESYVSLFLKSLWSYHDGEVVGSSVVHHHGCPHPAPATPTAWLSLTSRSSHAFSQNTYAILKASPVTHKIPLTSFYRAI